MKIKVIISLILFINLNYCIAQNSNIGIGTNNPHSSALLELKSTNKGVLTTRLDTANVNVSGLPATGLLIYQLSDNKFYYFNGLKWTPILDGEDFRSSIAFPDGFAGLEAITTNTSFVVPAGKNFYITNVAVATPRGQFDSLSIDNALFIVTASYEFLALPLIAGPGQVINLSTLIPDTSISINGFLINSKVAPLSLVLTDTTFSIPLDKALYIHRLRGTSNSSIFIDSKKYNQNVPLYMPLIIKPGAIITVTGGPIRLNGYLSKF